MSNDLASSCPQESQDTDRLAKLGREQLGAFLVQARTDKGLSLEQIAQTTCIPVRSLEKLEQGAFSALPADLYVRGFLRSYARCVGIDPEEAVAAYSKGEELVFEAPQPQGQTISPDEPAAQQRRRIPASEDAGARVSVTVAVIILVIVATLTLSVLMRSTSERSGDGVASTSATHSEITVG